MTVAFFFGFAVGASVAFFITVIFASVKYHDLYEDNKKLNMVIDVHEDTINDLESKLHPLRWDDSPMEQVRVKAHIYDKYEDLIAPGTEVLGPFGDDDG